MIVDCSEREEYEDIFLTIDGHKFHMRAEDYIISVKDDDG
jgi:hypothetical protein